MAKLKDGFYKQTAESIGSDLYVLLAGGGSKALSDFATISEVVTALGTNGNYVTWTKNGTANNLTVPYATTSSSASTLTMPYLTTQEQIDSFLESSKFKVSCFKTTEQNNVGFASNDGMLLSIPWTSTTYGAQLAIDDTLDGTMKIRTKSTTWGSWYKFWHAGNLTKVSQLTNDAGYLTSLPSHTHDNYLPRHTYTIPKGKSLRITFAGQFNAIIYGRCTLGAGSLILIGNGYGENRIRNSWTQLSNGQISWSVPASDSYSKTIEIQGISDHPVDIEILSKVTPTFTEISALTSSIMDDPVALRSQIPTKTSQLTNDSGYITSYTDTAAGKTFKTLSSVSHSGWTNNTTDDKILPTMSFIAYWNGAYASNNASNLLYSANGIIIGSSNYTTYTVKKDGTGATGTWGINISGSADKLDGIDSTGFLRQVVVANNTTNDFNTFGNMTLTGRVDPTTGASLVNAPWTGGGPAGGYGVLTYLFNGSGYGTQMAWGYNSNRIYIRNRYWGGSGVGSVWSTTWDSLALTSDLKNPTDYYWADQLITGSAKSNTTPTFGSVVSTGLITAKSGVQIGSTSDIGWYFYNSRICAGNSVARGVNTGSILVSNAWADDSKVPTNGIYSKGNIITPANVQALNLNLHGDWTTDFGINFNEGGDTKYGFSLLYGDSDLFKLVTRNEGTASTVLTVGRGSTQVDFKGKVTVAGRLYPNEWIQFNNNTGLYWPNHPNTGIEMHIRPNTYSSYGGFAMYGKRGGYSGILLGTSNTNLCFMDDGNNSGLYIESLGKWIIYSLRSGNQIGIGTSSCTANYGITLGSSTHLKGNLLINGESYCYTLTTNSSSNWVYLTKLLKGNTASDKSYEAGIGWHNTGGDGTGALTLVPHAQDSSPWAGTVGLYITASTLAFNGTAVSLSGHTHDDRYYTETESDGRFYPLAGNVNMSGDNKWIGSTMGGGTDYWRIGGYGSSDNGICKITIGDNSNDKFQIEIADYSGTTYIPLEVINTGINITGNATMTRGVVGGYNNTSYALSTASFICNSWIRTNGATGWYNEDYGGGWYMTDATWIRNYNSKPIYLSVSTYPSLVCNAQGGSEANIRFEIAGTNKGYTGYKTGYGTFLWNSAAAKYVYIADNGYFYTQSYINVGAGNEKNASNPPYVWGVNGSDNFMRTYATSSLSVNYANSASYAHYLPTKYDGGQQTNPQTYFNNGIGLRVAMTGLSSKGTSYWSDTLWINGYSGGDVPNMCALHFNRDGTPRAFISTQSNQSSSYGTLYELITGYNIGSQSVNYATYSRYVYCTSGSYLNFQWSGQSGQPTWLFGSNDGANVYVWNPSNFSVNYANSAGSATNATNASNVYINTSATSSYYPVPFVTSTGAGNKALYIDSSTGTASSSAGVRYNPSSNALYCSGGFFEYSDETAKIFFNDIPVDFDILKRIPKKYFVWKDSHNTALQIGTSAQKLQEMYPELVTTVNGKLAVSYEKLSVVALKAIDELYDMIVELKQELNYYKTK